VAPRCSKGVWRDMMVSVLARLATVWLVAVGCVALAEARPQAAETPKVPEASSREAAASETETAPPQAPVGLDTFLRAKLLESAGQFRPAMDAYAKALEENPDILEVKVRYASLLLDVGLVDSAVKVLGEVEPEDLDAYGLRILGLALAQVAAHQPEMLVRAETVLKRALDERGDDPNLQLSLAQVIHRQGRLEDAEVVIRELRQVRIGHPRLVAYHATLLRGLGRLDEAAELYSECAATAFGDCREQLVELLVELGRPGEAGEILLGGLGDDDLDQLLQAASLLMSGDRDTEALTVVRRVLDAEPSSSRARTMEAFLLSSLGRHDEAAVRYEELLRKDKKNPSLIDPYAWTQMRRGLQDEARSLIQRGWEQIGDPSSAEAVSCCVAAARIELAAGQPVAAREWLDRIADPSLAGVDLVRLLASSFRDAEQWQEGMAAMLRLQPQLEGMARTEALAFEAEFRLRGGDARGLARLRPLLASAELSEVLVGLRVLQMTERWTDVEREAEAALSRFPGTYQLLFQRASALERLGRYDEAEAVFSALVSDDPDDAATANYLGRGVRVGEALRLISRGVELEPDNPAYLDSMGWVHFRLGNLNEAGQWLRRAVGEGRADGTILSHLGEVLIAQDQSEEGRRYLLRALDLGCERPQHVRSLLDDLRD